jgi:type II restriction/modification system DNA methylase subunit YeeA
LPDDGVYIFGRSDDFFFGIVHSRLHEVWSLTQGTHLGPTPRYTPNTCFETFPFPRPTPKQETAIAAAAQELNALRERWLNPPEWTQTSTLEFRGTVGGAWSRYIDAETVEEIILPGQDDLPEKERKKIKVGTVRYPRLEPRDADCAAKLKDRTLTKLYNERPAWLDLAHKKLDAAVAAAYGWPADLSDEAILEKLLALNLARAAEEAKAAKVKKTKTSREKKTDEML